LNETGTSSRLIARFGTVGFFLFGYVKGKLMGYRAETPSELLVRIRVSLADIPRETLNAVFLEWMKRLQKYVEVDGEYVE
jgi:prophage maintenance system killer protein